MSEGQTRIFVALRAVWPGEDRRGWWQTLVDDVRLMAGSADGQTFFVRVQCLVLHQGLRAAVSVGSAPDVGVESASGYVARQAEVLVEELERVYDGGEDDV